MYDSPIIPSDRSFSNENNYFKCENADKEADIDGRSCIFETTSLLVHKSVAMYCLYINLWHCRQKSVPTYFDSRHTTKGQVPKVRRTQIPLRPSGSDESFIRL